MLRFYCCWSGISNHLMTPLLHAVAKQNRQTKNTDRKYKKCNTHVTYIIEVLTPLVIKIIKKSKNPNENTKK